MQEIKYKEEINYNNYAVAENKTSNIDEEIQELVECLKSCKNIDEETEEIYQAIRKIVMQEIKINELAVTIVLRDLQEIRKKNNVRANMITTWIICNDRSYEELGKMYGVSKQYFHGVIWWGAKKYQWIQNLMQIKGEDLDRVKSNVRKNCKKSEKQKVTEILKQLVYHPNLI